MACSVSISCDSRESEVLEKCVELVYETSVAGLIAHVNGKVDFR